MEHEHENGKESKPHEKSGTMGEGMKAEVHNHVHHHHHAAAHHEHYHGNAEGKHKENKEESGGQESNRAATLYDKKGKSASMLANSGM